MPLPALYWAIRVTGIHICISYLVSVIIRELKARTLYQLVLSRGCNCQPTWDHNFSPWDQTSQTRQEGWSCQAAGV
eukprot:jgi/Botrbrau1/1431/Bobra.0063s0123.1